MIFVERHVSPRPVPCSVVGSVVGATGRELEDGEVPCKIVQALCVQVFCIHGEEDLVGGR